MPPKRPKNKKKKKKKKKIVEPTKTKEEYEEEIITLNRELAKLRSECQPFEEEWMSLEDQYYEKKKMLKDVLDYLKYECEEEEHEILEFETKITEVEEIRAEQKARYEKMIQELVAEHDKIIEDLKTKIYNTEITLKILGNLIKNMNEQKKTEKELQKKEKEQIERHKKEIYELEKLNLRELHRIKKEYADIITRLFTALEENLLQIPEEEEGMEDQLICESDALGKKYYHLLAKLSELKQIELEGKIDSQIMEDQIKILVKRKLSTDSQGERYGNHFRMTEWLADRAFVDRAEQTTSREKVDAVEETTENKSVKERIEGLIKMAKAGLEVRLLNKQETESYSTTQATDEDPNDIIFAFQEKILNDMSNIINDTIQELYGKDSDYEKPWKFIPSKGYKKTVVTIQKKSLERHDLWRNWRYTTDLEAKQLRKALQMSIPKIPE